ncbi:hypothetical protein [Bradyrhizobium sp. NBAIM08]|uniref:Uncharacterized protein n=1 Tax=Bradyrhizobium yuanmingense TaxID=108015 RepID=A0ABV4GJW5_9BRAD|nr:hypothetical protein [Bradyrhizobium sp. NBAIM08]MCA1480694.1 hypothetical protein [Bradyrhizobium sp. NBAIM08]
MANEQDVIIGRIAEIEIDKSAAIIVEQIDGEISIAIASRAGSGNLDRAVSGVSA